MSGSKQVFVGLGSNIGDRRQYIMNGLDALRNVSISQFRVSPLYISEPWGGVSQDEFLNAVVQFGYNGSPLELLALCKEIEHENGRDRNADHWSPRTLDLDILIFGDEIVRLPELSIPHLLLLERRFVLTPLADLEPDLIVPGYGVSVKLALEKVDDRRWVKPYLEGESG